MFPEHSMIHALHDKQAEIAALARQEALGREVAEAHPTPHALRIPVAAYLKHPDALCTALRRPAAEPVPVPVCCCTD